MCGIAGCYLTHDRPDMVVLQRMMQAIAHRGPDGAGQYVKDGTALLHTRLSIIDPAGGGQPLYNEDKSLVLVANGEIYNYVELRDTLESLGHHFSTHSDCETILHAYEVYGLDCLQHLHGMFAFALYDSKHDALLLARDRLGIKPLFFSQQRDGLYFASEIKALLPVLAQKEINPNALGQYLQCNFSSGPDTLLQGVHRLLPGEVITIGVNGLNRARYWTVCEVKTNDVSFEQAQEQFDILMNQVMLEHMRSDVPFGLFLSGGVDSSILLALLSRECKTPIRTFSVGFPNSGVRNELDAAATIAERLGARHTAFELDRDRLWLGLPHCIWLTDELMGDYANLPVSLLAEQAGRELKVVFSGEGGDEAFAGYGRYRAHGLRALLRWLRAPATGGFRGRGLFSGHETNIASPVLKSAMQNWRTPFVDAWQTAPRDWSLLQKMQATDIATWLPDDLLVKADRLLMGWGVEGRVPFLDHRVVEFGLSLPDHLKINRKTGKLFLRQWAERMLPREHLWSKKSGFTVPLREWLSGDLLNRLETSLPQNAGVRQWLNPAGVCALIRQQRQGGNYSAALWAIMQFAIWHTLFIENNGTAPGASANPEDYIA